MPGLLFWMTWSVWMLKSNNILILSYFTSLSGLWIHNLTSPTNLNFWSSSKCTILGKLCLCLHGFWANFLHSVIKWVIDSSLSQHIPHLFDVINVLSYPVCSEGLFLCCKYQTLGSFFKITFPDSSPCLLTYKFFCFYYKFAMKLCLFIACVSLPFSVS